jgi:membrane protease YdiL (CAAX protease family)
MSSVQFPNGEINFACELCGKMISFPISSRGRVEICPHCAEYIDVPHGNDALRSQETANSSNDPAKHIETKPPNSLHDNPRTAAQLWLEVIAVLCLAYMPCIYSALYHFCNGYPADYSYFERELSLIICSLQVSMPLLLIMALTREPWSRFGICRPRWIIDLLGGCLIGCLAIIARRFFYSIVFLLVGWSHFHHYTYPERPAGLAFTLFMALATIFDAFSEELAMRAYLIPRLETLLKSKGLAILLTSLLFASYHLYQGVLPAMGTAAIGFVFGIAFCYWRRLWPLVFAHVFINLLLIFGR